jgi:uncharacterized protein YyaL (SSP411 family)
MTFSELAKRLRMPREEVVSTWSGARRKLLAARDKRARPARDEKILTGANALTISGLARAGRVFDEPDLVDASDSALRFLARELWDGERLYASWRDGEAELAGYLDDYADLLLALLDQLEARWDAAWLDWACALGDQLLAHFEDDEHGGFFLTADDHEALIHRPKPYTDDALPSGNGVAALALGRLGHVTGQSRFLRAAEGAAQAGLGSVERVPHAHASVLNAVEETLYPPETIIIRPGNDHDARSWRQAARAGYAPRRQVLILDEETTRVGDQRFEGAGAWLCQGTHCLPPVANPDQLQERLTEINRSP